MKMPQIETNALLKSHWSPRDTENAQLALDFVQVLMNEHDFSRVKKRFGASRYKQHNRNMKDGIDGVLNYVSKLTGRFPDFCYDVKNVFVDGDYVTLHSHATVSEKHRGNDRKGFNIVDTWRVQDGALVEHWDSVQPLDSFMRFYYWLTGGAVLNANGVFGKH